MKNRILSILFAVSLLVMLLPLSFACADGGYGGSGGYSTTYYDANYNAYMYSDPHIGIVICQRMNVRNRASTSGSTYCQIKNGQPVKVLGITSDNNFYVLDLDSCGATSNPGGFGYAKASLIKIDPEFFATTRMTNLYATPWTTDIKNGEQSGRFFLVLAQYSNWYAVQTMETSPGTSFVRMSDVGQYTQAYHTMYVVTWDTAAYDASTWAQLPNVKRFTPGSLQNISGDYTLLLFNEGTANQYSAWVPSQYVAPILN